MPKIKEMHSEKNIIHKHDWGYFVIVWKNRDTQKYSKNAEQEYRYPKIWTGLHKTQQQGR